MIGSSCRYVGHEGGLPPSQLAQPEARQTPVEEQPRVVDVRVADQEDCRRQGGTVNQVLLKLCLRQSGGGHSRPERRIVATFASNAPITTHQR